MITQPDIGGAKVRPRGRAPRRLDAMRVCIETDCPTMLSIYNDRDTCFRHSPIRFPRTRGRTKLDRIETPLRMDHGDGEYPAERP